MRVNATGVSLNRLVHAVRVSLPAYYACHLFANRRTVKASGTPPKCSCFSLAVQFVVVSVWSEQEFGAVVQCETLCLLAGAHLCFNAYVLGFLKMPAGNWWCSPPKNRRLLSFQLLSNFMGAINPCILLSVRKLRKQDVNFLAFRI